MVASSSRPDSNRTPPPSPSHCAAKETTAQGAGYLTGIGVGFWRGPGRHRQPLEARQALRTQYERHAKGLPLHRLAQGRPTRLSLGTRVTLTTFPHTPAPFPDDLRSAHIQVVLSQKLTEPSALQRPRPALDALTRGMDKI